MRLVDWCLLISRRIETARERGGERRVREGGMEGEGGMEEGNQSVNL